MTAYFKLFPLKKMQVITLAPPCPAKHASAFYGGRESSTHCNFRKHMQIEKAPANQENIFISLTAGAENAHNKNK